MDIERLQKNWDEFGKTDPLWSILTARGKKDGRWDETEFFDTGRRAIEKLLARIEEYGITLVKGSALDFGCGVGRLTQALALYFTEVHGVDIAPSMIDLARQRNQHGERCIYHLNDRPDLSIFPSAGFDFVLSFIVLQHMRHEYSAAYIREFVRVLKPGGYAVFQIPARRKTNAPAERPRAERTGAPVYEAANALLGTELDAITMSAGESRKISVLVGNQSAVQWPAQNDASGLYGVGVIATWARTGEEGGEPVLVRAGEQLLPADLEPGEQVVLDLAIRAPRESGEYVLQIDTMQVGVGALTAMAGVTLEIAASIRDAEQAEVNPKAVMEMYGTDPVEIERIVLDAGARVVRRVEDGYAGESWESYTYIVQK